MIVLVDSDDNEIADNNSRPVFCSYTEEILTDGVLSVLQREVTSGKLQNKKFHQS